jgi:hypothetical protein
LQATRWGAARLGSQKRLPQMQMMPIQ